MRRHLCERTDSLGRGKGWLNPNSDTVPPFQQIAISTTVDQLQSLLQQAETEAGVDFSAELRAIAKEDYSPEAEAAVAALRALAQELEDTHDDFCWTRYADQIPGGILLLFLLATLGALYCYNIRIAAFYHARADALVMTVIDKLILRASV